VVLRFKLIVYALSDMSTIKGIKDLLHYVNICSTLPSGHNPMK
jgi:hypothetical protein